MEDSLVNAINDRLMQGVSFSEISEMYEVSSSTLYRLDKAGKLARCSFTGLDHKERHIAAQLIQMRLDGLLVNLGDVKELPRYCPVFGMKITYLNEDPEISATAVLVCGTVQVVSRKAAYLLTTNNYDDLRDLFSYVTKIKGSKCLF